MSCTSIPNAHFIFYCTKSKQKCTNVLVSIQTCGCVGQTRIQLLYDEPEHVLFVVEGNRHECMTSHQLSVHLYWEDWEKQTQQQNELYQQSVSSPPSGRSIIDIVKAQNRPTWLRKDIDFKKTRSGIDLSPRCQTFVRVKVFGNPSEVDPERTGRVEPSAACADVTRCRNTNVWRSIVHVSGPCVLFVCFSYCCKLLMYSTPYLF